MWKVICLLILVIAIDLGSSKSGGSSSSEEDKNCEDCECELKPEYWAGSGYDQSQDFPKDNETALVKICTAFINDPYRYRCESNCHCKKGIPCLRPCSEYPHLSYCEQKTSSAAATDELKCKMASAQLAYWVLGLCTMTDFPICANDLCL
jgi:hypothetical protein